MTLKIKETKLKCQSQRVKYKELKPKSHSKLVKVKGQMEYFKELKSKCPIEYFKESKCHLWRVSPWRGPSSPSSPAWPPGGGRGASPGPPAGASGPPTSLQAPGAGAATCCGWKPAGAFPGAFPSSSHRRYQYYYTQLTPSTRPLIVFLSG